MSHFNYILLLALVIFSSCGHEGHIQFYNFDASKYVIEKEILKAINEDSVYTVPQKWIEGTKGNNYFETMYVYFKNNPEEMYQIGFIGDSTDWNNSSSSTLAIIIQFNGEVWNYKNDISRKGIVRITKRFEDEILSKIPYRYSKSN